jgi:hypothetical protein
MNNDVEHFNGKWRIVFYNHGDLTILEINIEFLIEAFSSVNYIEYRA